ncbi:GTP 3',8-cyclase MoaA [Telmatospirillum siberiense]|uniref:GTP 3',8-cyclase n=1 Tax=Telmatospirillum siberiense TaxID=382514 RepID=A0A2N3PWY7_9PROT|nr:GTP 3',8-cyclase MoaA [Telmatospirillum siberiense]PKU24909.1 GTP 3',8-cyclase MoaA [Telmatospirillum siberiense]
MIDSCGRDITYLRLSVTDRCNLRCVYCMGDDPLPLAHSEVLRIEELVRISRCFIRLGIRKLRITGGEPLVRKGIMELFDQLGEEVALGRLAELTMTTNGLRLAEVAGRLRAAGLRRVNVSLDTLDPGLFRRITRWGEVERVIDGIAAAKDAGLQVKINVVLQKGVNEDGLDALIAWAGAQGHDMTLIEAMPLGSLAGLRADQFLSVEKMRKDLASRWTLLPCDHRTDGPASFYRVAETGGRLGFIAAISQCFCAACNRVRMTCTGGVSWCLGQESSLELRDLIRSTEDDGPMERALLAGVAAKPAGHRFAVGIAGAACSDGQRSRMNRMGG